MSHIIQNFKKKIAERLRLKELLREDDSMTVCEQLEFLNRLTHYSEVKDNIKTLRTMAEDKSAPEFILFKLAKIGISFDQDELLLEISSNPKVGTRALSLIYDYVYNSSKNLIKYDAVVYIDSEILRVDIDGTVRELLKEALQTSQR